MSKSAVISRRASPSAAQQSLDLITVAEAAAILRVSHPTVRKLVDDGKLKGFKAGKSYRIHRQSLEQLISGD